MMGCHQHHATSKKKVQRSVDCFWAVYTSKPLWTPLPSLYIYVMEDKQTCGNSCSKRVERHALTARKPCTSRKVFTRKGRERERELYDRRDTHTDTETHTHTHARTLQVWWASEGQSRHMLRGETHLPCLVVVQITSMRPQRHFFVAHTTSREQGLDHIQ